MSFAHPLLPADTVADQQHGKQCNRCSSRDHLVGLACQQAHRIPAHRMPAGDAHRGLPDTGAGCPAVEAEDIRVENRSDQPGRPEAYWRRWTSCGTSAGRASVRFRRKCVAGEQHHEGDRSGVCVPHGARSAPWQHSGRSAASFPGESSVASRRGSSALTWWSRSSSSGQCSCSGTWRPTATAGGSRGS